VSGGEDRIGVVSRRELGDGSSPLMQASAVKVEGRQLHGSPKKVLTASPRKREALKLPLKVCVEADGRPTEYYIYYVATHFQKRRPLSQAARRSSNIRKTPSPEPISLPRLPQVKITRRAIGRRSPERERNQERIMGCSAKEYAKKQGHVSNPSTEQWAWAHLIACCFGGKSVQENLVLASETCNRLMLSVEMAVKSLLEDDDLSYVDIEVAPTPTEITYQISYEGKTIVFTFDRLEHSRLPKLQDPSLTAFIKDEVIVPILLPKLSSTARVNRSLEAELRAVSPPICMEGDDLSPDDSPCSLTPNITDSDRESPRPRKKQRRDDREEFKSGGGDVFPQLSRNQGSLIVSR